MLTREIINPWSWQEALGFVHGHKVAGAATFLFLAGQTASDEQGHCLCPDDMSGQIDQVLRNIGTILRQGGMDFTHVVRLNIYTTDMQKLLASHDHMAAQLAEAGCRHTGTLLGVSALASPGAMVEMEVTAAA
jgi:enamine deaminase RidA (YjgF/YER057c/UK114 family)